LAVKNVLIGVADTQSLNMDVDFMNFDADGFFNLIANRLAEAFSYRCDTRTKFDDDEDINIEPACCIKTDIDATRWLTCDGGGDPFGQVLWRKANNPVRLAGGMVDNCRNGGG